MNLRWLLGNFTDPQYRLSWREQFRVSAVAHDRYVTWSAFLTRTAIIISPFVLLLFLLSPILDWLGYAASSPMYAAALLALVLLFWPWSAWMYCSLYVRPVRKAMRDVGYDICIECGYELRGLDASITRCPECGGERQRTPRTAAGRTDPTRANAAFLWKD